MGTSDTNSGRNGCKIRTGSSTGAGDVSQELGRIYQGCL